MDIREVKKEDKIAFIHDFKAIGHMSPTAYLKSMSDFYNEPYKL